MKTTKEIHLLYEMNNESEKDISNDKWFSEEEIKKAIDKSTVDIKLGSVLINKNELIKKLLGDKK